MTFCMNRKLLFDCRARPESGIGRYITNILPFILDSFSGSVTLLCRKEDTHNSFSNFRPSNLCSFDNVRILSTSIKPFSPLDGLYLSWLSFQFTDFFCPTLSHPFLCASRLCVTVHDFNQLDLLPRLSPKRLIFYSYSFSIAFSSSVLFFNSSFTRGRFNHYFPWSDAIQTVTPLAPFLLPSNSQEVSSPRPIDTPGLLHVGSIRPHKNIESIFSALYLLRQRSPHIPIPQLVLVGGIDDTHYYSSLKRLASSLSVETLINFRTDVKDIELVSLYRTSLCLIVPSLYEGFGLPVLEALDHRLTVLAALRGALPEVGRNHCFYFSPESPLNLSLLLEYILLNPTTKPFDPQNLSAYLSTRKWAVTGRLTARSLN